MDFSKLLNPLEKIYDWCRRPDL